MRKLIVQQLDYDLTPVAGLALVGHYLKAVQPVLVGLDKAMPMTSVQGDEMVMTGKDIIGVNREILSTEYIGVIKNGEPVVLGKFR